MVHFQMDRVNGYYSLNDQFKAYMYKTFVTVQTPSYIIGADFIKNIGR